MFVSWNNQNIRIDGRNKDNADSCRFSFPGVSFTVKVKNGTVKARFRDFGCDGMNNCFNLVVDGKPSDVIKLKDGLHDYALGTFNNESFQELQLFKRTESLVGECEFLGFEVDDSAELASAASTSSLIEFVGDSITCGYGIEAKSATEDFRDLTENAWLSYASVASRMLGARQSLVCYSGRGVYRNWASEPFEGANMNDLFTRVTAEAENHSWTFERSKPDIVVVTLGSNDFSPPIFAQEDLFKQAYRNLIHNIRLAYGDNIPVFCLTGPVLVKKLAELHNKYVYEIVEETALKGDDMIFYFPLSRQSAKMGFGAQWHPSIAQAQKNGEELALFINKTVSLKK